MKLTQAQLDELKAKMRLSDAQIAELKLRLNNFANQADQAADSFLAKIGKSKYTWLIIIGIIATAWALGYIQH